MAAPRGALVATLGAVTVHAIGRVANDASAGVHTPYDVNTASMGVARGGEPPTPSLVPQRGAQGDLRAPAARSKNKTRPGRSGKEFQSSYVSYPNEWFSTPEYRRLSPMAVKVFQALYQQYKGRNNGDLTFTKAQARDWRVGERQRTDALRELRETGWIVRTSVGGLHSGPNLYAVTVKPIDDIIDRKTGRSKIDINPGTDYLHIWQDRHADKRAKLLEVEPRWRRRDLPSTSLRAAK